MTTEVKEDDFDAAFAEAAAQAEKIPEQLAEEAKAAETAAAKTLEQIAAEEKAASDAKTPEEKVAEEAAAKAKANEGKTPEQIAAEEKAVVDAKAAEETAKAEAKAAEKAAKEVAKAEAKAAEDAAREAAKETPEQKVARERFEESIKPYEPTEEEKKALALFEKDFPNEHAAVMARFKAQDRDINARVFQAVQNIMAHVAPRLESAETISMTSAQEQHFASLKAAHPDYDVVVDKIPDWIKTQPAYLQDAMQAVYDGGTASEVSQLIEGYKKANAVADPGAAVAAEKARVDAEKIAAAKKKTADEAAALEPVKSRRSAAAPTKGAPDPNDYDAAWSELAGAAK